MSKYTILSVMFIISFFIFGCDEDSNDGGSGDTQLPSFLFVQNSSSGTLEPIEGEQEKLLLTLNNLLPDTFFFSDRPARISGQQPTSEIVRNFFSDLSPPPNAALQLRNDDGSVDVLALSLHTAEFNPEGQSINYEVTIIPEELEFHNNPNAELISGEIIVPTGGMMPMDFGSNSLFIDNLAQSPNSCTHIPTLSEEWKKFCAGEDPSCKKDSNGDCICAEGPPPRTCDLYLGQFWCCINDPSEE